MNTFRYVGLILVYSLLVGCQSYVNSTPRTIYEGNNAENYNRVFKTEPINGVEVINSVVIGYSFRVGVVTTDDWEFELIAPSDWVSSTIENFHLRTGGGNDFIKKEVQRRMEKAIRPWYVVSNLEEFDLYRDITSVGYVHMLVSKNISDDNRYHVYISKH